MALFSKKNIKPQNPYGLTEDDIKGDIKDFPMGVVVRMLEEQELQGNKPDIKVFRKYHCESYSRGGFDWNETEAGHYFWDIVICVDIKKCNFKLFFERYPEYEMYNLQ